MGRGMPWTAAERRALARLRRQGRTAVEIACALGRPSWAVYRYLGARGLPALRGGGVRDPDVRRRCSLCGGPIYRDEPPGANCPDCRAVLAANAAAAGVGAGGGGPRVYRLARGPAPRQHGYPAGRAT